MHFFLLVQYKIKEILECETQTQKSKIETHLNVVSFNTNTN